MAEALEVTQVNDLVAKDLDVVDRSLTRKTQNREK